MSSSDRLSHFSLKQEAVTFEPSRHAGLQRLGQFKPRAGAHYANQRNFDLGSDNRSTVSGLSPWIKHRLVDEKEVLAEVFSVHDLSASMKFVQEVFWRGYFKGWMQQRPSVWHYYKSNLKLAFEGLERDLSRKAD